MRRPSIGRLMAMALAATIVCFLTIDTTMACRFLLRHRHFAPCVPVAPVECCDTVAAPVVEVAPCCGETVIEGPVVYQDSTCCGGEVVGEAVPADLGPPAPPAESTEPTPADPPADTTPDVAPEEPADEAAATEPEVSEPAEAEESALPDADEPAEESPLSTEDDAAAGDDLPELDDADAPAVEDADADAPADAAPATDAMEEDPLGGLDEEAPADAADADPLGDLPGDEATDAATDAADDLDVLDDQTSHSIESNESTGFREVAPEAVSSMEPAFRDWTDNTGRYKTKARLVQVTDSDVRLLKDNGRFTTVAKSRLSNGDLEYVEVMAKHLNKDGANQVASR